MIKNCMRSIDLMGPQPKLFINKSTRYQTIFGGFLTILIGFLSILCFIGFGIDIIQRKSPLTTFNKEYIETPILNGNDTFFAYGVMKIYGYPIENLSQKLKFYFELAYTNAVDQANVISKTTRVKMVPCSETEKFKNNFLNVTAKLLSQIDMYMCPPDSFKPDLEGKFGDSIFKILSIYLTKCVNSSSTDNCTPEEEVQQDLSEFYAHFLYLDHYVNAMYYTEPINPLLKGDMMQLSISKSRYDSYYFNLINFLTDAGWILKDSTDQKSFQYASSSGMMYPSTPDYVHDIDISLTNIQNAYTRSYIKLQTIFANTGGFIKFIMMTLTFANQIIIRNHKTEFLLTQFYKKYLKHQTEKFSDTRTICTEPLPTEQININKLISKKEQTHVLKPLSKWNLIFGRKNKNKNLSIIKKFETKLEKKLDIRQIFKNFEKLKIFMKFVLKKDYENTDILFYQNLMNELFDGVKTNEKVSTEQEKTKISSDKSNFYTNNFFKK